MISCDRSEKRTARVLHAQGQERDDRDGKEQYQYDEQPLGRKEQEGKSGERRNNCKQRAVFEAPCSSAPYRTPSAEAYAKEHLGTSEIKGVLFRCRGHVSIL